MGALTGLVGSFDCDALAPCRNITLDGVSLSLGLGLGLGRAAAAAALVSGRASTAGGAGAGGGAAGDKGVDGGERRRGVAAPRFACSHAYGSADAATHPASCLIY